MGKNDEPERTREIKGTNAECRKLQPENEQRPERKVPGEIVEEGTEGKALGKVEEPKNNPICEPLRIVFGPG